jgi:hypothetical protein
MKPIVTAFGVGLLAVATVISFRKKTSSTPIEDYSDPTVPIPATLNQNLILQLGSKGEEVKKLQSLMGVTADGIFGPLTEDKLYKLKGIKKISIKQFLTYPTLNQNILKAGTNVMAKLKLGTPIYNAIAKVDTSYYSDYKVVKTIPFGQDIGKIRSANPAGNWYTVYYETLFGKAVGFVKATDIDKY